MNEAGKNLFPELEDSSAASDQDCTGLMPTPPADGHEAEAYEELVSYLPRPAVRNAPGAPVTPTDAEPGEGTDPK